MRKNLEIIKWMASQIRPFILSFTIIIVIGSILSLSGVGMAIISKNLIDTASAGDKSKMLQIIIAFGVLILVQVGFQLILSPMISRIQEEISNNIRKRTFAHILRSDWSDYSKYHSGDLLTRMTRDIGMMVNIIVHAVPDIVALGVGLVAAFITLFYYEPTLAVLAFALGPAALLFSRFFGRRIKKFHLEIQKSEGVYRSFMHESIQNLLIVKAFSIENDNIDRIDKLQNRMVDLVYKRSRMSAATNSVLALGYWIGYFLAFGWGIMRLADGTASFGTLAAFLQLVGQVHGPFVGLAYKYPKIVSAMASGGRLMDIEEMGVEVQDMEVPCWSSVGIQFHEVSFAYNNEKPVLKDTSIEIKPGEIIALMGASGDGKTTFIRLMLSFIKAQSGRIHFINSNGERIEASVSSRSLISYVPQGNTLFSGTIEDNMRIGCPNATEMEMKEALIGAGAWDFILELPEGIRTVIGEKGLGLSEGQAQRIAIARAFIRKTPILILDEATSALDLKTEKRVLQTINSLPHTPTCIVITHRPSALRICQRVIKIKDCEVVECSNGIIEAAATQEV